MDETPSVVAVATYGGSILEDEQWPNFHLFKEEDLSKIVFQLKFKLLVLNHKKPKELLKFRIHKHRNNDVVLLWLPNRHTNLAPLDSDLINELPIKITILQTVYPKSEEVFQ